MPNPNTDKGLGRRDNRGRRVVSLPVPSSGRGGTSATTQGLVAGNMPAPVEMTNRPASSGITLRRGG